MVDPTDPTLTREATLARLRPFTEALQTLAEETKRLLDETHPSAGSLRSQLAHLDRALDEAAAEARNTIRAAEHETANAAFADSGNGGAP